MSTTTRHGFTPQANDYALRVIVDRHTAQRVGYGLLPVPTNHRLITGLYECGRPIPDIALAVGVTVADVTEALGVSRWCESCGMAAKGRFVTEWFDHAYGAEAVDTYQSDCCGATVRDGSGREAEPPGREF